MLKALGVFVASHLAAFFVSILTSGVLAGATSSWGASKVGPVMLGLMGFTGVAWLAAAVAFGLVARRWVSSGALAALVIVHVALGAAATTGISFMLLVLFNR